MISKPRDWDSAPAYDGSNVRLTAGGHICRILHIVQTTSQAGKPMVAVQFDVDEGGEFDGYYVKQHKERQKRNNAAKYQGVIRFMLYGKDGGTNPYFKGFIKSLEESNGPYKWDWNEKSAENKKIGIIFREEEYQDNSGVIRNGVKPYQARSVQAILDGVPVPEKKTLQGHAPQAFDPLAGFVAADDVPLPF